MRNAGKIHIDNFYHELSNTIKAVGREVFGTSTSNKFDIVPGWKEFVKQYHQEAREAFLAWRSTGSPREGPSAERMRATRARFKLALRECKVDWPKLLRKN